MNYIVTYDLNKSGQNYDGLINAIKSYPYFYVMQSTWFVKSNLNAVNIYNHLRSYIDDNDDIFICEINNNRLGWIPKKAWDFLDG